MSPWVFVLPAIDRALVLPALRALASELGLPIHDIGAHWVDGAVHVEAHVTLDGGLTLREAHGRVTKLERESRARIEHLAEIVTHIEPADEERGSGRVPDSTTDDVAQRIRGVLSELSFCGTVHDIRVYTVGDSYAASLHCLLDPKMSLLDAHRLSDQVEDRLRDRIPRLSQVVVHSEPLVSGEEI